MGLIKAAIGAAAGTLADQWKEFFYCDRMPNDVLAVKGKKRTTSRSSNTNSTDNIITQGSVIAVADNQCMVIVEQGRVVEVCAEPGEFRYDSSTAPTIFAGSLGEGVMNTFREIGKRFTFGGVAAKDQRVYYINTRELMDNKFGTPTPIPFHIFDKYSGFQMDANLRCNGTYTYRITDPLLFYTEVCVNFGTDEFKRDEIETQLKADFIANLGMALAPLSEMGVLPSGIPAHTNDIVRTMNDALSAEWSERRGISITKVTLTPPTLPPEEMKQLQEVSRTMLNRDPRMASATIVGATADALRGAANNAGGAMVGFAGMGMAMNAGGIGSALNSLNQMGEMQPPVMAGAPAPQTQSASAADTWTCACGTQASGKFCPNCGKPRPAAPQGWSCPKCGSVNQGKFCTNCGEKKPAEALLYRCDKCGWTPPDPKNPPKFCPECGDPFDDRDVQR